MKRPKPQAAALRIDTGPTIRVARGEVEITDRADIGNPNATVRGGSLRDPIKDLERVGTLQRVHWLAAERFRDAWGLAAGASENGPAAFREFTDGGTPAWARCFLDRQIDAQGDVRSALQTVGLIHSAVFVGAVLEMMKIADLARSLHIRRTTATSLLVVAMDRLVAHFAIEDSPRARVVRLGDWRKSHS